MISKRKLITFDWAIKRLLRSKANFGILEGFLSELLKENITILDVLESERYTDCRVHKFNRVDLKVHNQKQEIIIIEIQYDREYDYLQRIFYAVSKIALEHMEDNSSYASITKVISINILMKLPEDEQKAYEHYKDDLRYQASMFESSFGDGYYEGKAIGMEQGLEQGIQKGMLQGMEQSTKTIALKLLQKGESTENIADLSGRSWGRGRLTNGGIDPDT